MKTVEHPLIVVKKSGIHHKGIFAKKDIPKRTFIVEYVGEKISKAEGTRREKASFAASKKSVTNGATYIFELNKKYDIDGDVPYNIAKYMNHSCDPNCDIVYKKNHIWLKAKIDIKRGDEITYNYDFSFKDCKLHKCHCGSKRCVGYILAERFWKKL